MGFEHSWRTSSTVGVLVTTVCCATRTVSLLRKSTIHLVLRHTDLASCAAVPRVRLRSRHRIRQFFSVVPASVAPSCRRTKGEHRCCGSRIVLFPKPGFHIEFGLLEKPGHHRKRAADQDAQKECSAFAWSYPRLEHRFTTHILLVPKIHCRQKLISVARKAEVN